LSLQLHPILSGAKIRFTWMSAAVAAEAGGHSSLHHHVLDVACNSGSFLMYDVCTDAAWPIMVRNRPQRLGTAGCISHPEEVWKSRTSFQLIEHGRKGGVCLWELTLPTLFGRKSLFHKHLQENIIKAPCHALLLFPESSFKIPVKDSFHLHAARASGLGIHDIAKRHLNVTALNRFHFPETSAAHRSSVRNVEEHPSSIYLDNNTPDPTFRVCIVHRPFAVGHTSSHLQGNNIRLNQKLDAYLNPSLNTATSNTLKTQPFLVMAGVDPYATFRISLQAKVSNNLPFGFQDPAFAPLNSKIFAPKMSLNWPFGTLRQILPQLLQPGLILSKEPPPLGLYGALRASQALARIAAALGVVLAAMIEDSVLTNIEDLILSRSTMELIKKSVFYFSENGSPIGVGFCVENHCVEDPPTPSFILMSKF
ncbi:hypothetical protein PROFUN_16807, partial [Planoprotostelium fungivorum]